MCVQGYSANEGCIPSQPSCVLLLSCFHLGVGAGTGQSLPKRGTVENPRVLAASSPLLTAVWNHLSGREVIGVPVGALSAWGAHLGLLIPSCGAVYLGGRKPALGGYCYRARVSSPTLLWAPLFPRASPTLPYRLPPFSLPGRRSGIGLRGPGRLEKVEEQPRTPLL